MQVMNYQKLSTLVGVFTLCIVTYTLGYTHGVKDSEKGWRARLIAADYAEYDKRTGEWQLRAMEDVVTSGLILGQGKLPEADPAFLKRK